MSQITSEGDRVSLLLDRIWDGNRSAMARDVGCSHTALANIASGRRKPGRELLRRIAAHDRVSPEWLFSGIGEPLREAAKSVVAAGSQALPVFAGSLPSAVSAGHCSGWVDVPRSQWGEKRFCYRLSKGEVIAHNPAEAFRAGDLLVFESDAAVWTKNVVFLNERMSAIRMPVGGAEAVMFARVKVEVNAADFRLWASISGSSGSEVAATGPSQADGGMDSGVTQHVERFSTLRPSRNRRESGTTTSDSAHDAARGEERSAASCAEGEARGDISDGAAQSHPAGSSRRSGGGALSKSSSQSDGGVVGVTLDQIMAVAVMLIRYLDP